jgi:ABC-type glycerol-3-phosphate transport system substrate-binding protein
MKTCKTIAALASLALLAACGGSGQETAVPQAEPAEASFVDIGDHVIHFSAQSTDQLPLEVARAYNIERNKHRAMLNVSVLEAGTNKAVTAEVTVKTVNLTGQLKNVTMRMIQEQDAIYYIGETPVANQEVLRFEISVTPDGTAEAADFTFQRQFYTN